MSNIMDLILPSTATQFASYLFDPTNLQESHCSIDCLLHRNRQEVHAELHAHLKGTQEKTTELPLYERNVNKSSIPVHCWSYLSVSLILSVPSVGLSVSLSVCQYMAGCRTSTVSYVNCIIRIVVVDESGLPLLPRVHKGGGCIYSAENTPQHPLQLQLLFRTATTPESRVIERGIVIAAHQNRGR